MEKICWAPAKLNLCLHVVGKRPDGYHDLRMVMQRISLCDRLRICLLKEKEVRVVSRGAELPEGTANLAGRAAKQLLDLAGEKWGVAIDIEKRIPVAAGLGGGSSDAATVLMALNEMLDLRLDFNALRGQGRALGADVPFFIFGGPALAEGIGDILTDYPIGTEAHYVLVNPGFPVSTAWVYQNLVLTSKGDEANLGPSLRTYSDLLRLLRNDLEAVTVGNYPILDDVKRELLGFGADGVLMCGSGPTVFGVFQNRRAASRAAVEIAAKSSWQVFQARPFREKVRVCFS
ncbi:MAG: 4-(cytidine 5'-diphospho)-2-C-methyl-D-erythritol kinase [Deltaproteobacteria bacterium]|nr:4-(cytidine 5'-diphospho)-2-C-methyl-D-erythritol kinase [Deltaproteobacteria bacterium]